MHLNLNCLNILIPNVFFCVLINMVITRSRLGNVDQNPEPHVLEHSPEAVPVVKPVTMEGVQEMIWARMAKQREEMRQMLCDNRDAPTKSIMQPDLNTEQSKEENYSRSFSQAEPCVI